MKEKYTRKKRNTGDRTRKQIVLLSVEGQNKTEKNYFNGFNNETTKVVFTSGNETDPVKLSKRLLQEYKDNQLDDGLGDLAFCVVDGDVSKKQEVEIRKAETIVKKKGKVIVSNPCIEVWFLFHFTDSTRQYKSSQEAVNRLKEYIPDYEKNMKEIYNQLFDKLDTAISNAKKLDDYNQMLNRSLHSYDYQPSSEIYKIIEKIQNID